MRGNLHGMDCTTAREAISATLDGEEPGVPAAQLDEHVTGCRSCSLWRDAAADVTRMARLAPVGELPDVTEEALAGFRPVRRKARRGWLRWAVAVVALCQLGVVVAQFLVPAPPHGGGHLLNETAAFNLAVAVALLYVAARPAQARSQWPVLLTVSAALVALSAIDVVQGAVGWGRLGTHLPLLVGALLSVLLGTAESGEPRPGRGRAAPRRLARSAAATERSAARPAAREHHEPPAARRAA